MTYDASTSTAGRSVAVRSVVVSKGAHGRVGESFALTSTGWLISLVSDPAEWSFESAPEAAPTTVAGIVMTKGVGHLAGRCGYSFCHVVSTRRASRISVAGDIPARTAFHCWGSIVIADTPKAPGVR